MKYFITLCLLASGHVFSLETSHKQELLDDIKTQTKKCVVQLISPKAFNDELRFKSVCNTLKIISKTEAEILIEGEWLSAIIEVSQESDGGDLDDLAIINSHGARVALKTNIPSYDNIVVAMAGDSNFKKVYSK